MGQVRVERDDRIARIPRQQDDFCGARLMGGDEILASKFVPPASLGAILEAVVREDDTRDSARQVSRWIEDKVASRILREVSTKKCA